MRRTSDKRRWFGLLSALAFAWPLRGEAGTDACAVVLQTPNLASIPIHSGPGIQNPVIAQRRSGQLIGVRTTENREWAHLHYIYEIQNWRLVTLGTIDGWVDVQYLLEVAGQCWEK
jgi:hypothetical protein